MSNGLDLDRTGSSVGPDPGPNCLQRLSADYKSHHYHLRKLSQASKAASFYSNMARYRVSPDVARMILADNIIWSPSDL